MTDARRWGSSERGEYQSLMRRVRCSDVALLGRREDVRGIASLIGAPSGTSPILNSAGRADLADARHLRLLRGLVSQRQVARNA
jgi:hypothetical protein